MPAAHPLVVIVGPTAGGKTPLAIELARALPGGGECLSADSMQIYRGMDIGTAKPTAAERAAIPHHLIDLVDPTDDGFTVDAWLAAAGASIATIRERGRWPIVVGGTNLYVKALLEGLFDGPPADEPLRRRLDGLSADELRRRLQHVDPPAAERIHPNDRRRTIRALEVHELTGRRLSDLQGQWGAGIRPDAVLLGLEWPVEAINRRINDRVRSMVDAGLVEEVRRLRDAGRLGRQAREGLGYRQVLAHLDGEMSLDEAIEQIKIRTRRFAKQQRTWLRRFRALPRTMWLPGADIDAQTVARQLLRWIAAQDAFPAESGRNPAVSGPSP